MKIHTKDITLGAMIAAIYLLLTLLSYPFGLSNGPFQLRISEALCILPCFIPAAVWGLFVGCILSGIFTGAVIGDIIFGSLATLIGAVITFKMRKKGAISLIAPIISNSLILPFVFEYAYKVEDTFLYFFVTIGISEIVSCGILGTLLYSVLRKHKSFFEDCL